MRLTCPNCDAEYEVPDEVIPAAGRDVQCSNCGDTWYQYHPDHMPDEDAQDGADLPEAPEPAREPSFRPDPEADDDIDDDGWSDEDETGVSDALPSPEAGDALPEEQQPLRRRPLSPEVKSILQEEAVYEERARAGAPLESQPDLGLGEPEPDRGRQAREIAAESRLARVRADADAAQHPPQEPEPQEAGESRRNLLPDIEEINSTLRRKGDPARRAEDRSGRAAAQEQRLGFRRGFVAVIVLAVLMTIIYLQAPQLADAVPALAGPLEAYVAGVDDGRMWLDEKAETLAERLDAMSDETAPDQ
ncbi:MJ0042 family finger-like domain protein [Pseudooceanicola batsensis HTCC2597]|uniref:MJ0042 family finger-like domain protein n=1 Tax=Pseudooceanicola batsensis (strain ATCC BAA-863 / DSM 15984 / KCTC 12145 / HTCC2597) TaxID=252305 RepID=A3TV59_PSEBH|nr:zinc-ribbon domain-containing protein [Pseudooceanicola batsensis]EAQ04405.1 MJ0042 family finger-like domain protein [Pseudooceanicola batsensis HTCC2597]